MKIFDNGLIQGDNWYIARSNGAVDGFTPATNNLQATGGWKVLRSGTEDQLILAEISRIQKLRISNRYKRLEELGYDLDRGKFIEREAEVAYNIETDWGYLKRYKAPEGSGKKGDWIGISGKGANKTFDHFGLKDDPMVISNNSDIPKQRAKFFESLDEHFTKADYVILDIEYVKKYNPSFHQEIMNYIVQKYGLTKLIEYK